MKDDGNVGSLVRSGRMNIRTIFFFSSSSKSLLTGFWLITERASDVSRVSRNTYTYCVLVGSQ